MPYSRMALDRGVGFRGNIRNESNQRALNRVPSLLRMLGGPGVRWGTVAVRHRNQRCGSKMTLRGVRSRTLTDQNWKQSMPWYLYALWAFSFALFATAVGSLTLGS